jgi:hypothetical protein
MNGRVLVAISLNPFKLSIVCKKIIELRFFNFVSSRKKFLQAKQFLYKDFER